MKQCQYQFNCYFCEKPSGHDGEHYSSEVPKWDPYLPMPPTGSDWTYVPDVKKWAKDIVDGW